MSIPYLPDRNSSATTVRTYSCLWTALFAVVVASVVGCMVVPTALAAHSGVTPHAVLRQQTAASDDIDIDRPPPVQGAPDHLAADLRAELAWGTPISKLAPLPSGPGVIVYDPAAGAGLADFAHMTGAWLALTVGGCPEFGKTPRREHIHRTATELGKANLGLGRADSVKIAQTLGATHVFVGSLTGTATRCTLQYRCYGIGSAKPKGATLTASGTEDDIVSAFPSLAREMVTRLGGSPDRLPTRTLLTASDVRFIAVVSGADPDNLPTADKERMAQLASKSAFAAQMYLLTFAPNSFTDTHKAASWLFSEAPDNAQAISNVAALDPDSLIPFATTIQDDVKRHPNNLQFRFTERQLRRSQYKPELERRASDAEVRASPHNPYAWSDLSATLSEEGSTIRRGRPFAYLNDIESQAVDTLYRDWVACTRKAAALDPRNGDAWLDLCKAATFCGDAAVAEGAFWKAARLSPSKAAVYRWGLEMFQQKWGGSPSTLAKVVALATNTDYPNVEDTKLIIDGLYYAGAMPNRIKLDTRYFDGLQAKIKASPDDWWSHWNLAVIYADDSKWKESLAEYKEAERIHPQRAKLHYLIGMAIADGDPEGAVAEYRQALAIDPDSNASIELAWNLNRLKRSDEALTQIQAALAIYPYWYSAHYTRAVILEGKNDAAQAIQEYERAIALRPLMSDAYEKLLRLLDVNGRYDEALVYARKALTYFYKNSFLMNQTADVYLNKHQANLSAAMSEYAIKLNQKDAWAHENLGEAYMQLGEKDKAHAEWNTVIALGNPGMAAIAEKMLEKYP